MRVNNDRPPPSVFPVTGIRKDNRTSQHILSFTRILHSSTKYVRLDARKDGKPSRKCRESSLGWQACGAGSARQEVSTSSLHRTAFVPHTLVNRTEQQRPSDGHVSKLLINPNVLFKPAGCANTVNNTDFSTMLAKKPEACPEQAGVGKTVPVMRTSVRISSCSSPVCAKALSTTSHNRGSPLVRTPRTAVGTQRVKSTQTVKVVC